VNSRTLSLLAALLLTTPVLPTHARPSPTPAPVVRTVSPAPSPSPASAIAVGAAVGTAVAIAASSGEDEQENAATFVVTLLLSALGILVGALWLHDHPPR
jgi:drug/metabolite transporter (DMT)-like permease